MSFRSWITSLFRPARQSVVHETVRARYDAASDANETRQIWALSDALDADTANSLSVRKKLRERARYVRANDGDCAGMVRTQANYVIGLGPKLRLQTQSRGFNAMVEAAWCRWCRATGFTRKLRTLCKAKVTDGEAIATVFANAGINDQVKLDFRPLECDRLTDPNGTLARENYVDGIEYDADGNPAFYDILNKHPGASLLQNNQAFSRRWPAKFVLHWYNEDRPEQHRGVCEYASTLNLFATSRRYREAVVAAAETAADFSVILEMPASNDGPDEARPFSSMPIEKRMMVATPGGAKTYQMRAEQPTATYDGFTRAQTREKARPVGQPYNIAAADSSGYSFSGGRLDHTTYFVGVDVERDDCELQVIDRLFALWFEEAARVYGWVGDNTQAPAHQWAWPAMPQIDDKKTADARKTALACGATRLGAVYEADGLDFDDEVQAMAAEYGVTEDEMRKRLFEVNLAGATSGAQPQDQPSDTPTDGGDMP